MVGLMVFASTIEFNIHYSLNTCKAKTVLAKYVYYFISRVASLVFMDIFVILRL